MSGDRILIKNGRVIDPASERDEQVDLTIASGKLLSIGTTPESFEVDREIDASGCLVLPGFIDLCARLRDPGHEQKGTVGSETRAAASAGFTTLCCPPDTLPVIDTPAVANLIKDRAEDAGYCEVFPTAAMTQGLGGSELSEMGALGVAGCLAVSNEGGQFKNSQVMRRAMEYAASYDLLFVIRPEDQELAHGGCVHEGDASARLGLPGIPEMAETAAVAHALELIRYTGVRAHFSRLSSGKAAKMIGRARHDGLPVTADVSAHQLFMSEQDVSGYNGFYHVRPPLRTIADRERLRQSVADGIISAICSDHQPHEKDAKLDVFQQTEPGIASIETVLPLLLELVDQGVLTLQQAIARVTQGPAELLGIDAGRLSVGESADLTIVDPELVWEVGGDDWLSRGRNSPFIGRQAIGRAVLTIKSGKVVFDRR